MSFIGAVLSFIIPLAILTSCGYAVYRLIHNWDNYKKSIPKLVGFILLTGIIFFIAAFWMFAAVAFNSISIITRPTSDAVFNFDKGMAQVEVRTTLGEYRGASIFGSGGYEKDWITLNRKTVFLECYIEYFPLRTGVNDAKLTLYCPGDYEKYILGVSADIYPDDKYVAPPSYCGNCVNYRMSDFTSKGYTLPDEKNTRIDIIPRNI